MRRNIFLQNTRTDINSSERTTEWKVRFFLALTNGRWRSFVRHLQCHSISWLTLFGVNELSPSTSKNILFPRSLCWVTSITVCRNKITPVYSIASVFRFFSPVDTFKASTMPFFFASYRFWRSILWKNAAFKWQLLHETEIHKFHDTYKYFPCTIFRSVQS